VGNNGRDCAFSSGSEKRRMRYSAFNGGIVVGVPVLSIGKLLNDSVLFLVVITEIELAVTLSFTVIIYSRNLNVPVCGSISIVRRFGRNEKDH
jgi:hypothetical protein